MTRTAKALSAIAIVAACALPIVGCTEDSSSEDISKSEDSSNATDQPMKDTSAQTLDLRGRHDMIVSPNVNCGHILYCTREQGPEYQCYSGTGCTFQQQVSDADADCAAVCGSAACSYIILHDCPT